MNGLQMGGHKIHGSAMHGHKMHGSTVAHSLVKCKVLMLGGLISVLIRLPHPHRAISVVWSVALLFIVLHSMLLPQAAMGENMKLPSCCARQPSWATVF